MHFYKNCRLQEDSNLFDVIFQEGECVAKLLAVDADDLYRNLLKPKIRVGNEFVTQGKETKTIGNGKKFRGVVKVLFAIHV